MKLQGKRVLVTGGAGFIGSNLAESLQQDNEVTVIDNFRTGKEENLRGLEVNVVRGDIRDQSTLEQIEGDIDIVFHLAAMASVVDSFTNVMECESINIRGTLNLLEFCRLRDIERFVFTSSAAVYGNEPTLPKRENMRPDLRSPYAATKEFGETISRIYWENYGIKTVSLRHFNVYGPRQDPSNPYSGVISIFLDRAARNEDIYIYGDGSQTRDFIYISDVVSAYSHAAQIREVFGEPFNISTNTQTTILNLAEMIITKLHSDSRIVFREERIGDIRLSVADNSRAEEVMGWRPRVSFEQGLDMLIEWFLNS